MRTVVRYLCLLITATRLCEANLFDDTNQGIEIPENCTLSTEDDADEYFLTCPDLRMSMKTSIFTDINGQEFTEYNSWIKCSPNFLPYKYLPNLNSNRNSLVIKECQLPEHGLFGEGWPKLEFFVFTNSEHIGPLKREHFSGLKNVWNFQLHINSSSHAWPDDLFADLTNLRELRLTGDVNKNVLKNLSKLEMLRIMLRPREHVDNFDSSDMTNSPAFKAFEIYMTDFTRLTKRLFEGCNNVEDLQINHSKIEAIDADAFEPLTNLKNITFLFNDLSSLPQGIFSQNLKLENVIIRFSDELTSLPDGFLSNLPNLREIEINCRLYSIPNDFIHGSFNLELLNLEFNRLSWLPRDLLQNHTKLKKIKLYANRFNDRSYNLFDSMSPGTEVTYNRTEQN